MLNITQPRIKKIIQKKQLIFEIIVKKFPT